ncbi:hypothetical protein LH435_15835, partial [Laribacter hongkongensis]|uniref:Tail fiber protein n=2 Tax=Laribacter hongkongensis TaxID=168471 RepID=C1D7V3_LARHH|nr:hypothetical protein [Laribacter hongkongensis]ACO74543.1 hypothetical protein LHK_01555 [Laribacter hongkongensis HLHK9]MCG8994119.1 hypothetical protein [Laribacter hongkongensis]MCG9011987.1 hypothetical protein [Laribacter hongkongensis]MCG9045868.1 hypothetical protein [Laribacter hongkongensis]MCG9075437.1 hypothetical protein [Laribacter hongkongensis]
MSVSSEVRKAGPFLGNGTAASFPFGFKVFEADDVKVVQADAGGVETTLSPGVDYSVTLNPEQESAPGGSVVLNIPLPIGERLAITSSMANLQPITLTNQGGFYPEIINAGLDRLTILVQQIAEQIGRAIKVNISSSQDPAELVNSLFASADQAASNAATAVTAANAAAGSAAAAADSERHASESAASAGQSATSAAADAASIHGSVEAAAGHAASAASSAASAAGSAATASSKATEAAASAGSAMDSKTAAANSAAAAASSEQHAGESAASAARSENHAAESARQAAESAATASAPIDAHEAKPDPHPQYATDTELSALSQSLSGSVQSAISIAQSKVATVNGVGPDASGNVAVNIPGVNYDSPQSSHLAIGAYALVRIRSGQMTAGAIVSGSDLGLAGFTSSSTVTCQYLSSAVNIGSWRSHGYAPGTFSSGNFGGVTLAQRIA